MNQNKPTYLTHSQGLTYLRLNSYVESAFHRQKCSFSMILTVNRYEEISQKTRAPFQLIFSH